MTFLSKRILVVVPARGGRVGVPRKNLRKVAGRSLIAHVGEVVTGLDWIDHTVLSTEDEEIAEEGRRAGLDVPFTRPEDLAGDLADSIDVWQHAWLASEERFGERFDVSVLLQPTSPTRRPEDVELTARRLIESGARAAATVSRTPGDFTPEKTLRVDDAGRLEPYLAHGMQHTARQIIPSYFHCNGLVYAATRASLVDERNFFADDCLAVPVERPVVSIDDPIDLEWAEFLMQRQGSD